MMMKRMAEGGALAQKAARRCAFEIDGGKEVGGMAARAAPKDKLEVEEKKEQRKLMYIWGGHKKR